MTQPLKLPYGRHCIEEEDVSSVIDALRSPIAITRGPKVREFEEAIAEEVGARHAICFTNASAALWAACAAIDLGESDEALVPTNTFVATATCAMARRAKLRLLDVEPQSGNCDLEKLKQLLEKHPTERRRVFLPVHFAGPALDMKKLSRMMTGWSDVIIEDAAEAIGSSYPTGEKVGSCAYSDMTIFSFHAVKTITCGEGGAITTQSDELAARLRRLRNSGITTGHELGTWQEKPWFYAVTELSCNTHMHELSAALGLSQLKRLEAMRLKKKELLEVYREKLDPSLDLVLAHPQVRTNYHLAVSLIDFGAFQTTRAQVMHKLFAKGIGTQVHFIPLYQHPIVAKYPGLLKSQETDQSNHGLPDSGWPGNNWLGSEDYYSRALSLPLFPKMERSDVIEVVEALHQALAHR